MKRTIYRELICIFVGVLIFSNLITAHFVTQSYEYNTIEDMKSGMITSVEEAKEIYVKYGMSIRDINYLFKDKAIPIRFINSLQGYDLTEAQILQIDSGDCILLESSKSKLPVAISKADDVYIVSDIGGHSIFASIRDVISLNSSITIIVGSIIFMVVGKMAIKPIRELMNATKKVARGDFSIDLKHNRKDEIGELIDSFNKMTKELSSIEILRNDFVSDISHEFKTPITSIEGYTKLLSSCNDAERNEFIDIILNETKRLSTMATNILTINRLDYEDMKEKEEFQLDEQIRKSILLLENKWSSKELDLDVDLDEVVIKGNKGLINQIWINLLDNAIKFSPKAGTISIELNDNKETCEFIIKDEGPGIEEEGQRRVFDKFYKGDISRNSEGTGLGLSIVKRIVDLHKGSIELSSVVNQGTKISIILNKQ